MPAYVLSGAMTPFSLSPMILWAMLNLDSSFLADDFFAWARLRSFIISDHIPKTQSLNPFLPFSLPTRKVRFLPTS